jgi:hypothetical protein
MSLRDSEDQKLEAGCVFSEGGSIESDDAARKSIWE